MNLYHHEILEAIKKAAFCPPKHQWLNKYLGSENLIYNLKTAVRCRLLKDWAKKHLTIKKEELETLLDSLAEGESLEEKISLSNILRNFPRLRQEIKLSQIENWLENLNGWCEVDSLCQNTFPAKEILARWSEWEKLIRRLNKNDDLNKKRASLVLLCKLARDTDDIEVAELALELIDGLKKEKSILITKAISWLLRSLIKNHRSLVENYLAKNAISLPAIAVRETRNKLATGNKNRIK